MILSDYHQLSELDFRELLDLDDFFDDFFDDFDDDFSDF